MTVHVTIELTEDQKARLEAVAAHQRISVSQVLVNLAEENARRDAEFRALVQEGIDAADRGETFSHEEVMARMEARIAELEARKAG